MTLELLLLLLGFIFYQSPTTYTSSPYNLLLLLMLFPKCCLQYQRKAVLHSVTITQLKKRTPAASIPALALSSSNKGLQLLAFQLWHSFTSRLLCLDVIVFYCMSTHSCHDLFQCSIFQLALITKLDFRIQAIYNIFPMKPVPIFSLSSWHS